MACPSSANPSTVVVLLLYMYCGLTAAAAEAVAFVVAPLSVSQLAPHRRPDKLLLLLLVDFPQLHVHPVLHWLWSHWDKSPWKHAGAHITLRQSIWQIPCGSESDKSFWFAGRNPIDTVQSEREGVSSERIIVDQWKLFGKEPPSPKGLCDWESQQYYIRHQTS